MAYHPNAWATGSQHDPSGSNRGRPRAFNDWQHQTLVAFSNPFPQSPHPDLNLDTNLNVFPSQHDTAVTPTQFPSEPIKHWTRTEEPWSSIPLSTPRLDTSVDTLQSQHQRDAFAVPRSPARSVSTASAMGPVHTDSAYCSNASPIANEPTTAGSDCPEVTEMFTNMPYQFSNAPSEEGLSTPVRSNSRRAPTSVHSNADENMSLPEDGKCKFCQAQFRLKSELKKHVLRHTKPFRCAVPNCNGHTDGFTTSNDLDRHNRSVHAIFPKGAKVYVCGAKHCAEGEKTWPRYDNFKQHCERMHKYEDLDSLLHKSERQAPPPPAEVEQYLPEYNSEYGKKPGAGRKRSVITDSASMPAREAPSYSSPQESAFYDNASYAASDTSSYSGYHGTYSDMSNNPSTRIARKQIRNIHQGRRVGPGDAASMDPGLIGSGRNRGSPPRIVLHQADIRKQQQQQQQQQISHMQFDQTQTESPVESFSEPANLHQQHHPRTQPVGQLHPNMARSRSLSSNSSISSASNPIRGRAATFSSGDASRSGGIRKRKQDGAGGNPKRVRCKWPGCNKADMRPCELKKHQRRHSRPFGCTFDFCHKAFGSKNDWKRHEASQHFQDEMWRCSQPYAPTASPTGALTLSQSDCESSKTCAMGFSERDELATHLTEQHGITDKDAVDTFCDKEHIDRNHCNTFWCGFCRCVIQLKNEGRKGWDERFDHIGAHFHPEERSIKDWVPPIGNETKGESLLEKQQQALSSSDERSDVDAQGDADVESSFDSAIVSPVDSAPFVSGQERYDNPVMSGLEFTGMGPSLPQNPSINTSFNSSFSPQVTQSAFSNLNGQLPSPVASGSEACPRRRRRGSLPDPKFCCICQDGPMNAQLRSGLSCLTCGHICGEGCEG